MFSVRGNKFCKRKIVPMNFDIFIVKIELIVTAYIKSILLSFFHFVKTTLIMLEKKLTIAPPIIT